MDESIIIKGTWNLISKILMMVNNINESFVFVEKEHMSRFEKFKLNNILTFNFLYFMFYIVALYKSYLCIL